MKIFKFFSKVRESLKKAFTVEPIKYIPTQKVDQNSEKVETEKDDKCQMCGSYSGNYIYCNTCTVIISVG